MAIIVNIVVVIPEVIYKDNDGSDIYYRPYKRNLIEHIIKENTLEEEEDESEVRQITEG